MRYLCFEVKERKSGAVYQRFIYNKSTMDIKTEVFEEEVKYCKKKIAGYLVAKGKDLVDYSYKRYEIPYKEVSKDFDALKFINPPRTAARLPDTIVLHQYESDS